MSNPAMKLIGKVVNLVTSSVSQTSVAPGGDGYVCAEETKALCRRAAAEGAVLLKKPGELHFKTDNRPLFDFSLEQFEEAGLKVQDVSFDLHAENRPDNIMTEYERKFSGFGEKINRCEVIFA